MIIDLAKMSTRFYEPITDQFYEPITDQIKSMSRVASNSYTYT